MARAVVGMAPAVVGMTPADVTLFRAVVLASLVETEWHKYNERNKLRWVRYQNALLHGIPSRRRRTKRPDVATGFDKQCSRSLEGNLRTYVGESKITRVSRACAMTSLALTSAYSNKVANCNCSAELLFKPASRYNNNAINIS
jgi:hypothetical protein